MEQCKASTIGRAVVPCSCSVPLNKSDDELGKDKVVRKPDLLLIFVLARQRGDGPIVDREDYLHTKGV